MTIPNEIAATVSLPIVALVTALTITPADLTAMFVAVTALITALGIAVVNIMAARSAAKKLDAIAVAQTENDRITRETSAKADVIEGHVNSASSKADEHIAALQNELRTMREAMAEKKEIAALLAQAAATAGTAPAPASTQTGRGEDTTADDSTSLKQIDRNTAQTATNTASTDKKVDALKDGP